MCSHPSIDKFDAEFAIYVAKGEKYEAADGPSSKSDSLDLQKLLKFLLAPVKQSGTHEAAIASPPEPEITTSLLDVPGGPNHIIHRRNNGSRGHSRNHSRISNNRD